MTQDKPQPGAAALPHVPALDGLRGVALLGVLAFHADGLLTGGYLGVDLFFVLSGYLITALLLAEHARSGQIDLRGFWARRARRLLPAVVVLMPAVALYALFFSPTSGVGRLRWDALATLAYVANWREIFADTSYWDLFHTPSPLQHTWSLAIEEQFYLLWPLIARWALAWRGPRGLFMVSVVLTLLSMAALWLTFHPDNTSRAYYGTDTRAAGLLAGALLAIVLTPERLAALRARRRTLNAAALLASLGLAYAWVTLAGQDPRLYRGGLWLTELGVLVILTSARLGEATWLGRLLAWSPLRFFGRISYGAYLWHWPIFLVVTAERVPLSGALLQLTRLGLTVLFAWLSLTLIEEPVRRRRWPLSRPILAAVGSVCGAGLLVVSATHARPWVDVARSDEPALILPQQPPLHVTMHGDSTANSLGWCLRGLNAPWLSVDLLGQDGLNIMHHAGPAWPSEPTGERVIVLGGAFLYGITVDDKWTYACEPAWHEAFESKVSGWLVQANPSSGRLWLATLPYPLGRYDDEGHRNRVDCINDSIRDLVREREGLRLLDLHALLCPQGTCARTFEDRTIRPDGVHYEIRAARGLSLALVEALRAEPTPASPTVR